MFLINTNILYVQCLPAGFCVKKKCLCQYYLIDMYTFLLAQSCVAGNTEYEPALQRTYKLFYKNFPYTYIQPKHP